MMLDYACLHILRVNIDLLHYSHFLSLYNNLYHYHNENFISMSMLNDSISYLTSMLLYNRKELWNQNIKLHFYH